MFQSLLGSIFVIIENKMGMFALQGDITKTEYKIINEQNIHGSSYVSW